MGFSGVPGGQRGAPWMKARHAAARLAEQEGRLTAGSSG
jgi:hypothetical protein